VLLIDRKIHEALRELDGDPVCGVDRYREPLALAGIPDQLDALAAAVAAKHRCSISFTAEGRARLIEETGGRPLFMMWALESIATTGDMQWRTWQEALRPQVVRFESELKRAGLSPDCFHVLALATLTRGMSWNDAMPLSNGLSTEDRRQLIRLRYADRDTVLPVQPDVFGEFFLLEQMESVPASDRERLLALAWSAHPTRTSLTLYNLCHDFHDHAQLAVLDAAPREMDAVREWGMVRVYLLADNPEEARRARYLSQLQELASRNEAALALPLAAHTFNSMKNTSRQGDWSAFRNAWVDLQALAAHFHDDRAMQFRLASGAVVAVSRFGSLRNWEEAAQGLEALKAVAQRFPDSPEIQHELAMGHRDVVLTFGSGGMWAETLVAWRELQETARRFPENLAIQVELARGASDLLAYSDEEGQIPWLEAAWQVLEAAAAAAPHDARMQESLAIGVQNRMRYLKDQQDMRRCWAILEPIAVRFGDDRSVQRVVAAATSNAIYLFGKIGDLERVEDACRQLQMLTTQHTDDRAIHAHTARGLVYEMRHRADQNDWPRLDQAWQRLRAVGAAFPLERSVQFEVLRGESAAYTAYLQAGHSQKREDAENGLEAVRRRFPNDGEMYQMLERLPFSPYRDEVY
jgi:hypothetical protein